MRKWSVLFLLPLCFLLSACSPQEAGEDAETSVLDTSAVSQLARQRFDEVLPDTEGCEIQEKSVYIHNADPEHVVIVFHYSCGEKKGDYGLEYRGTPEEGFQLLREGADVTGELVQDPSVSAEK